MLIDLSCPIENQGTIVKTNSETNEPYLLLKLFNLSEKTITAISFQVLAYDSNGTELGRIPVELADLSAESKAYFAENKAVSLVGMENAKHFVVQINRAVFSDDTEYVLSEENIVEADETVASIDDALLLRQFIPEAVCFFSERDTYFKCPCGRVNFPDAERCIRCGRTKTEMAEKFSSIDTLTATINKAAFEEEQRKAEEEARLAIEKELKIAKQEKMLLVTMVTVLILAILSFAGFFVYRAVLNKNADSAMQNSDYYKAYELYQKTGSKKIAGTIEFVQGNTPENINSGGFFAADDEHLYYLTFDKTNYTYSLVKESKATKETSVLTDAAAGALNITEDWIYFLDAENMYVKRISKDGETIENVVDETTPSISVIGNTIYYIRTDYDNPNNLAEEQCAILAAQGQMDTFTRLYKMDENEKKPSLVSEESMISFSVYGDRIYYLSDSKDTWQSSLLYSMDLNGKDKQLVVNVPVASFVVRENNLYYIEMFNESIKGQEVQSVTDLSYTIIRKNLETGETETLGSDYLSFYLNANDEKLFFMAMDKAEYLSYTSGESETNPATVLYTMSFATGEISPLVSGGVSLYNVVDDDVIVLLESQDVCRVKADGTGFESLVQESAADTVNDATEE